MGNFIVRLVVDMLRVGIILGIPGLGILLFFYSVARVQQRVQGEIKERGSVFNEL